jgi:HSP20 family protein
MSDRQQLLVQRKKEHEKREETTIPARVFVPTADIYETQDALTVILEMPGVEKSNVTVQVEDGLLHVEWRLDLAKYQGLQPLYTEYNIRPLCTKFPAFQQDRSEQNRRRAKRRRPVLDFAKSRRGQAASHHQKLGEEINEDARP